MAKPEQTASYAHNGHRLFNEKLAQQAQPSPARDVVKGPWLSNDAMARLPGVRREFEKSRDPHIAHQRRDMDKTETQRREEQTGCGSSMVKRDQPKAILRPPKDIRIQSDAQQFRSRWLAEKRNAAMAQQSPQATVEVPQREMVNKNIAPER